jgi:WD40 repeat protein
MFDASEPLQGGMLLQALQLLEEQQEQQKVVAGAQSAEDKAIEAQLLSRHAGPKNNVCRMHASFDSIHKANILTVRFSPAPGDDLIVATGSVDKSLKLTNLSSGATLFELAGGIIKSAVLCIEFHPMHPQLVLCGCMDGSVFIVDTSAPLERAVVHHSTQHRKYVVAVKWLPVVDAPASASASSSDDQKEASSNAAASAAPFSFASASYDHTVTLWSAAAVAANGTPDKWTMKREHVFAGTVRARSNENVTVLAIHSNHCL